MAQENIVLPFALTGGLNQTAPQITLPPGTLTRALNFETPVAGGYRRVDGYDRYDGKPSPATIQYVRIPFAAAGPTPIAGSINGATSSATALVVLVVIASGSYATNNAAGVIFGRLDSGAFTTSEVVRSGVSYRATLAGATAGPDVSNPNHKTVLRTLRDIMRVLINRPPGSGPVLGTWSYKGVDYAWRNNASNTEAVMYRATTSAFGWEEVPMLWELSFTAGATQPAELATVTKGGTTARVRRVVLESGDFATSTAAGRLIIDTIVGGPFTAGAFTAGFTATCSGADAKIVFPINGKYRCFNHNFFGSASTFRMYGCTGVSRSFEFDDVGDVLVPINTRQVPDAPTFIEVHKNYMWAAFSGGLVQRSGVYSPYGWSGLTGAAVIGAGAEITGLRSIRNDYLGIFTRNTIQTIFGATAADFQLKKLTSALGALPDGIVELGGEILFYDQRGVFSLKAAEQYGDFIPTPLSAAVQPFVSSKGARLIGSIVSKRKTTARWFFDDKTYLTVTVMPTQAGMRYEWLTGKYAHQFVAIIAGEDIEGNEKITASGSDGYVYEVDKGNSFAGEKILSLGRLAYNNQRRPNRKKRYKRITIDGAYPSATELKVRIDANYGSNPAGIPYDVTMPLTGGEWGSATWGSFVWGGGGVGRVSFHIASVGENVSATFFNEDDIDDPYTIQTATITYDMLGESR